MCGEVDKNTPERTGRHAPGLAASNYAAGLLVTGGVGVGVPVGAPGAGVSTGGLVAVLRGARLRIGGMPNCTSPSLLGPRLAFTTARSRVASSLPSFTSF